MRAYDLAKPALFALPPETAHGLTAQLMRAAQGTPVEDAVRARYAVEDDRLKTSAFGCSFPTPVGVAAGFDKNAHVPRFLAALGFGHVEVGGVTAEAQAGNPRPRLFRLPEDRALVNRMGFNNDGADEIGARLAASDLPYVPVGVNVGKSKSTPLDEAPSDYLYTFERVGEHADYVAVNVSSPNTPGLRSLQNRDALEAILGELLDAGADTLLVKFSPDLPRPAIEEALAVVDDLGLDGVVATNTTTERPDSLRSPNRAETGGLSGEPIEESATSLVRFIAERTDVPVVGVGGVSDAEGAYRKIRAGASVVQLYTALIYEGPGLARDINEGLLGLLERDGFDSVADAVGADLD
ncbi:quinone-dependent dihydroorotate dehydrogenase [Halorarum halophilum]|uniref:Dihydroorotate dehydrogenase (quinone) n=1 Tax=Halorarum halophilum TaxID=2743090 RepID=A0A7D5K1U8_9EURY|nr:quinone-dependent dihydroorotate dehydrogenase [Halobaculum halophilum]QLG28241.1 quinone-dependent dihydroorotate dehydrogenase [Halobaculum halophilum]